jgi:hypothetical protein
LGSWIETSTPGFRDHMKIHSAYFVVVGDTVEEA